MLDLDIVIKNYKPEALDGRDIARLVDFIPLERWEELGVAPSDEFDKESFVPLEWNEENIKKCLERDLEFAFEKALNCRSISSAFMHSVICMWMYILEENELLEFAEDEDNYAMYGLPFFKAVAVKLGFKNPIGDDFGNESKYREDYDEEE